MLKFLNYCRLTLFVSLSLFEISTVHAQMQQMMQKGMNAGRLYGKVVDAKTGKPVEFAAVQISVFKKDSTGTLKENILNGQLTQGNGDFNLDQLPVMGELTFKIAAMGYKDIRVFKKTTTGCYEIYARTAEGRKAEVYFNPVDGSIVEKNED